MTPAGYLLKRVASPPGWLSVDTNHVVDVCSVADCVNEDVVNVQEAWKHNGFGVANNPETIEALVESSNSDVCGAKLFYYSAYEQELESDGWIFDPSGWQPRSPAPSAGVQDDVKPPSGESLTQIGYDIVVFGDYLEHSPLSCNSIAEQLPVNQHCLFDTLEEAVIAINRGAFGGGCEPGRYQIFSVSIVG